MTVDAEEASRRIIQPSDFAADTAAFIDVRMPRSAGKASYSFIGPGVSQNPDQTINLTERHGYNVGAASMPHGVVNNPHLHFTAEVFLCTRGSWRFAVGEHGDQQLDVEANTIFSVPTWVFRGFENIGGDDGWLFTVLGGDDTGGILWAPHVLRRAAETGLFLSADYTVLDALSGDSVDEALRPLGPSELDGHVDSYSDAELAARMVTFEQLAWSDRALLSSVAGPAHTTSVAPVIGFGITQNRRQEAPIRNPHGFSMEWLSVAPGAATGLHRVDRPQSLFLVSGDWEVRFNRYESQLTETPAEGSIVSLPAGCWRDLANTGDQPAYAVVVTQGDERAPIEWSDEIVKAATDAGWGCDASGYLAPTHLLGRSQR